MHRGDSKAFAIWTKGDGTGGTPMPHGEAQKSKDGRPDNCPVLSGYSILETHWISTTLLRADGRGSEGMCGMFGGLMQGTGCGAGWECRSSREGGRNVDVRP